VTGDDADTWRKALRGWNAFSLRMRASDPDDADDDRGTQRDTVTERRTRAKPKTRKPPLFKAILLNDDYTPMEFVVEILKAIFNKPHAEATRIMLHVHQNGMGVAGVYPHEIAEAKVKSVEELARENQYPLKCVIEKE
jgi:ATP-dependent Clp protease adaptor protein ClpS